MRIWAFPSIYPFPKPGLTYNGIFAHRQYKGLIENGAELQVIYPVFWHPVYPVSLLHHEWDTAQKAGFPLEREYEGIKVYHPRIPNIKPNRFVKKDKSERFVDTVVKYFRDRNITLHRDTDIFYSQWLPNSYNVQKAARLLGVKSAIIAIGDDIALWPHTSNTHMQMFRQTWEEADMRFAFAEYLGHEANKILGKDLPFEAVRSAVNSDLFKPASDSERKALKDQYMIPAGRQVILNIGTASKRKGWIELFDALEELKKTNSNFHLVAVHTWKPEFSFAEEINKRGLQEHFLDLGEVPPGALNKIYQMADIFCLPSHAEGMANVVIEAMSCGLPVITTTVGGHRELVTNGQNGLLIPPQSTGHLSDALIRLIDNAELRNQLGKNAREFILTEWGSAAKCTKALYSKLVVLSGM